MPRSPVLIVQVLTTLQLLALVLAKPPCAVRLPCRCTDQRIKCVQQQQQQQQQHHLAQPSVMHYLTKVPYFAPLANQQETRWQFSYHELRIRGQAMLQLSLRYDWGLLKLSRVEVTGSLVRSLEPGAFRGLHGIETLNLSNNLLTSLGHRDLDGLVGLRELVLYGNRLKTLQTGLFRETPALARLYLSDNQLNEVPPDLRRLTGLTHLYLQRNNISRLPNFAFYGLRRLIILDLGGLRPGLDIRPYAFCGLSASEADESDSGAAGSGLVALYLRDNWLPRLDLCALGRVRSLRGLNLTGSRFPCDCQAAQLIAAAANSSGGSAGFAGVSGWSELYGFAPRYVAYDSRAADGGPPDDCGRAVARLCLTERRACPAEAACPNRAPPLSPTSIDVAAEPATRHSASLTVGPQSSYGRRLSIRDGIKAASSSAGRQSLQLRLPPLLLLVVLYAAVPVL